MEIGKEGGRGGLGGGGGGSELLRCGTENQKVGLLKRIGMEYGLDKVSSLGFFLQSLLAGNNKRGFKQKPDRIGMGWDMYWIGFILCFSVFVS